jgi:hypothetical protein
LRGWTGIGRPHPAPSGLRVVSAFSCSSSSRYGGYFGAGIGILMLSAFAVMGLSDIHQMNASRPCWRRASTASPVVFIVEQDQLTRR